jgi:hypothetical protein
VAKTHPTNNTTASVSKPIMAPDPRCLQAKMVPTDCCGFKADGS